MCQLAHSEANSCYENVSSGIEGIEEMTKKAQAMAREIGQLQDNVEEIGEKGKGMLAMVSVISNIAKSD